MNASAGINNKLVFVTVILCKYFNHCVSVADGYEENVELRNHQVITWGRLYKKVIKVNYD